MVDRSRLLPALAAMTGFLAVVFGAFGAHGVSDPAAKDILRTGAQYGLAHTLAVYAALVIAERGAPLARTAGWLFLVGAVIFSGSLYALALSGVRVLGAITPFGGLAMMAGWLVLAWAAFRAPKAA
jgi:uncharacterized membrane protein YgdD (TMEM256/DUF423 family)